MLFRRFIVRALMTAARNPHVQRKAGKVAGKAMQQARPGLMKASHRAGELTRKAGDKLQNTINVDKVSFISAPIRIDEECC